MFNFQQQATDVQFPADEIKGRDPNSPEAKKEAADAQKAEAKLQAEAKAKDMPVEKLRAEKAAAQAKAAALKEATSFGMINLLAKDLQKKPAPAPKAPKKKPTA